MQITGAEATKHPKIREGLICLVNEENIASLYHFGSIAKRWSSEDKILPVQQIGCRGPGIFHDHFVARRQFYFEDLGNAKLKFKIVV